MFINGFIVFFVFIYWVLSFLITRQVKLLNHSFDTDAKRFLSLIAFGNFMVTTLLLTFSIIRLLII